jgi:predicted TIM-barrel fold metal-dependent hydrolase
MADHWIDVHAHFTPPTTREECEARWKTMREELFMVSEPYEWAVESTLDYMDRAGIQMQLLSNVPKILDKLRASNDYGASIVSQHPSRFGLLAALPTDNPQAALSEIERAASDLHADGYAVTCHYNGVYLSDPSLDPVWTELDRRHAVIFVHPNAYAPASLGRPSPLLEVAFETTRTLVDMLYAGMFRKFPNMKLIIAHCGAALPALSGRLIALGTEVWVPNPNNLTKEEMKQQLSSLYLDTAASGRASSLAPALTMTTCDHIVYGSDSGVPCSTEETLEANRKELLAFSGLSHEQIQNIGRNALNLFPSAAARIKGW